MSSNSLATTKKAWWENLVRRQSSIADLLPRGIDADRFVKSAYFALTRSPKLFECEPSSVFTCILKAAEAGLDLSGVGGEAYLIPFKQQSGRLAAQFITGYRGLIKLAFRSGKMLDVETRVVYEGDEFTLVYGLDRKLVHIPALEDEGDAKRKVLGAYCIARFKDGGLAYEYMSRREIDAIRARSRAANAGPWVTDWTEMARKTVARRASKYWPAMDEMDRALSLEEEDVAPGRGLNIEIPKGEVEPEPEPEKPEETPAAPREPGDDSDEDAAALFDSEPEPSATRTNEVKAKLGVKPKR